jgi:hypothetical protein
MSIFEELDTLCERQDNKCKQRKKCWRYLDDNREGVWIGDFYGTFGEFCNHFVSKTDKTAGQDIP